MPPTNSNQNQPVSFVPKRPITSMGKPKARTSVDFFTLISVMLFIVSIVLAGGVFAWKWSLEKSIASDIDFIKQNESKFDSAVVDSIIKLDDRIESSKNIISKHLAPSKFLEFLGGITLSSVRFNDFSFSFDEGGGVKVLMSGEGIDFPSIALQSDVFAEQGDKIKNPIMSDFSLEPSGRVKFNFSATVPLDVVKYINQ